MDIISCPRCATTVVPRADGTCPACRRPTSGEVGPAAADPIPAARPTAPGLWRRARGRTRVLFGEALTVLGFIVTIPAFLLGGGPAIVVHVLFRRMGHSISTRGRRQQAQDARSVLAADPRPPILYLRSFGDDGRRADRGSLAPSLTFEQRLAEILGRYGPVVAVGRPGERLPELGASRFYVDDDRWREQVADLMGRARAVVLWAGASPGLLWELEAAARCVAPDRLVIGLPFAYGARYTWWESLPSWARRGPAPLKKRERAYQAFRRLAEPHLPGRLPPSIGLAYFLFFDAEGEPKLLIPGRLDHEAAGSLPNEPLRHLLADLCRGFAFVRPVGTPDVTLVIVTAIILAASAVVIAGLTR